MSNTSAEQRSATVLVADDESTMRNLLRRWLVHEGYRVQEAEDGIQALVE